MNTQICQKCNQSRNLKYHKRTVCSSCYNLEWATKNRERRRELDRQNYQLHKVNRIGKVKIWQELNPSLVKSYKQTWRNEHPEASAAYRAAKLQATPPWADLETITRIYKARPEGMEVDHIIPLQGKNVCGLHVDYNLQYLTESENSSKGNRI